MVRSKTVLLGMLLAVLAEQIHAESTSFDQPKATGDDHGAALVQLGDAHTHKRMLENDDETEYEECHEYCEIKYDEKEISKCLKCHCQCDRGIQECEDIYGKNLESSHISKSENEENLNGDIGGDGHGNGYDVSYDRSNEVGKAFGNGDETGNEDAQDGSEFSFNDAESGYGGGRKAQDKGMGGGGDKSKGVHVEYEAELPDVGVESRAQGGLPDGFNNGENGESKGKDGGKQDGEMTSESESKGDDKGVDEGGADGDNNNYDDGGLPDGFFQKSTGNVGSHYVDEVIISDD